jgi:hypothetical protein
MSGQQIEECRNALCAAFNQASLDQMLRTRLNKDREQLVGSGNMLTVVFNLIVLADQQGWFPDLIASALDANAGNAALRKFCEENPDLTVPAAVGQGDDSTLGPDNATRPTIKATVNVQENSAFSAGRTSLETMARTARELAGFPEQVLNVYPARLREGLRWGRADDGWSFQVNTDGSVKYHVAIAEHAMWMEWDSDGSSKPGTPKPAISALHCLLIPVGIVLFWKALAQGKDFDGTLRVLINGASGRVLSFNGLDRRLTPSFPHPWNYTFWNHDSEPSREGTIVVNSDVSTRITREEAIRLSSALFAEIGFFFGFRVIESPSHSPDKIRDLTEQLLGVQKYG